VLNLNKLRFVHASKLQLGDIAFLDEIHAKAVIVCKVGERLVAVQLDQSLPPEWLPVERLEGSAAIIEGVVFEVDPNYLHSQKYVLGDLVVERDTLSIVTKDRGPLLAQVADGYASVVAQTHCFSAWRAIAYGDDGEFVVFEKKPLG
jgi:hypothetical protein